MEDGHGWAHGLQRASIAAVFQALGQMPEARHVAEREQVGQRSYPAIIWYVLPDGLLEAKSTENQEGITSTLTAWRFVSDARVLAVPQEGNRAQLALTVGHPVLATGPQADQVPNDFSHRVANPSWAFIEAVRGKLRNDAP